MSTRMTRRRIVTAFIACAAIGLAVALTGPRSVAQSVRLHPGTEAEIRALQVERFELLRERERIVEQKFRQGQISLDTWAAVVSGTSQAELALSRTKGERIDILERHTRFMRDIEEQAAALRAEGGIEPETFLALRATRLDAEVSLLREQAEFVEGR